MADTPRLKIKVDNKTKNTFDPATNPKAYYLKHGIVMQVPSTIKSATDPSTIALIAEIGVEPQYTDGIQGIVAFKCKDGGEMGELVLYFNIPAADSEDNDFRVSNLN